MTKFQSFVYSLNVVVLITAFPTDFPQSIDVNEKPLSQENSKKNVLYKKAFNDDLISVNIFR